MWGGVDVWCGRGWILSREVGGAWLAIVREVKEEPSELLRKGKGRFGGEGLPSLRSID